MCVCVSERERERVREREKERNMNNVITYFRQKLQIKHLNEDNPVV